MAERIQRICVLVGMHIIALLSIGCAVPCFSFFLIQFKEEFGVGSALIGTANSLCIGLTSIIAPVATVMNRSYGYRVTIMVGALSYSIGLVLSSYATHVWQVFFTHSLLTGGGVCITFQTMVIFVGMNFKKSLSLGNGILFAAIGLGMMIIPLMCSVLDRLFGWKGAIRIMGAICLNSVVIAAFIFRRSFNPYMRQHTLVTLPEHKDENQEIDCDDGIGETSSFKKDDNIVMEKQNEDDDLPINKKHCCISIVQSLLIFKTYPRLLVMAIALCFICVGYSGFFVHMIANAIYRGVSEFEAAVIFGAFGVGNLIGRLANALPLYFKLISETNLFILCLLVVTACMSIFGLCTTFKTMLCTSSVIGLFFGMYIPQIPSIIRLIVPNDSFDHAYALCIVPSGITSIFGGYIAGAIYDKTGTYKPSFFFASANYGIVTLLLLVTEIIFNLKNRSKRIRIPSQDVLEVSALETTV